MNSFAREVKDMSKTDAMWALCVRKSVASAMHPCCKLDANDRHCSSSCHVTLKESAFALASSFCRELVTPEAAHNRAPKLSVNMFKTENECSSWNCE